MSDVSFVTEPKMDGGKFETDVFEASDLKSNHGIDARNCAWFEIRQRDKLYGLFIDWLSNKIDNLTSFTPVQVNKQQSRIDEILGGGACGQEIRTVFGLGVAAFEHHMNGNIYKMHAVHQRRGPVVGTNCGPVMYQNLILFVEGKENKHALTNLCENLLAADETSNLNEFTIFRWNVQNGYWQRKGRKVARSISSVVLPQASKDKILNDLDEFLTRETYAWYTEHGIPYKRSYLFYGVPGGGKTSLLQALAGKYRRNLCILQPTDPRFTDDKLADAIKDAPSRSILVLEDVDALFAKDRSKTAQQLQITFSGLLNALDGISNPDGQIFILTTNFREQLDAALIRNGRVDLHLEFTHAQPEQMRQLFLQFYPSAQPSLAASFAANLQAALGSRQVAMAALQHYFISHRRSSAEEAAEGVQAILDDMDEKDVEAKQQAEQKKAAEQKEEGTQQSAKSSAGAATQKQPAKASVVHVHVHTGASGSVNEDE